MKQFLTFIALTLCYTLCGAQATTLMVDNQTPGWLSSKINYGDQQTVENLTVTGYVNSDDLKFIGTMMEKHHLNNLLDLSDVLFVGDSNTKDNNISFDNIFSLRSNVNISKLLLPTTIDTPIAEANAGPLRYLDIDTLVYGGKKCPTYNNALWGYTSAGGIGAKSSPKHLILRNGVTHIAKYASCGGNIETVSCPNSLKTIEKEAFSGRKTLHFINLPNEIEIIEQKAFSETSFTPDTLYLPSSLTTYYTNSFPIRDTQVVIIPETVSSIDNTYQTYNNMQNTYYTHDYIESNKKYIWVMKATTPPSVRYYYEGFLKNTIIYVPKGSQQIYLNTIPYKYATIIEMSHPVTGISLNKTSLELPENESEQLIATIEPHNASDKSITWTSSDISVAMVSRDGTVYAIKPGQATIMATSVDGGFVALCKVTVTAKTVIAESLSLSISSSSLTIGETLQLYSTIQPENTTNKNIRWTSTNTEIATVTESGLVTAIKEGNVQIIASTTDGSNLSAICEISISSRFVPISQIAINPSSVRLAIGENLNLQAIITPTDATNKSITWSSTNSSVVTVDSNGLLTAKGSGNAIIIAFTQDGTNLHATCTVDVDKNSNINDIEITPNDIVRIYNLQGNLVYEGQYTAAQLSPGIYIIISHGNSIKRIIR